MPDTGSPHLIPYPAASDVPNGPSQMQAIANQVAARLGYAAYAEVLTSQNASSATPQDLATVGPSVTVVVPTNALIVVYAQATITGSGANPGSVYLAEDGTPLVNEANTNLVILSNTTASAVVTYTKPGSIGGTVAKAQSGPLIFPASAGSHTYKLMYGIGTSAGPFSNRKLWLRVFAF